MKAQFKQINDYFAALVSATNKINKFISVSDRQLQSILSSTTKVDDPFLVLFGYEGKLSGNDQRTIGTRTVSFSILYRVSDPNDFSDQYKKINLAEEIGLQVLARINQDSHPSSSVKWLHSAFQKDSVHFQEVFYQSGNGLFGCEFHFDLEVKNPLTVKSGFWTDKEFC